MKLLETTKNLLTIYLKDFQNYLLIESNNFINSFEFDQINKYCDFISDIFSDFAHEQTDNTKREELINYYLCYHDEIDKFIKEQALIQNDNLYEAIETATFVKFSDNIIDKLETERKEILQALTIKYFIESINIIYNKCDDSFKIISVLENILNKINDLTINNISDLLEIIKNEL